MAILNTNELTKYFGGLCAVDQVSFSLEEGEILGLIGPNGAGKTTLVNLLTGHYAPTSGAIMYRGQTLGKLKADRFNQLGIARTFQMVRVFKKLTVLENVLAALVDRRRYGPWSLAWNALLKRSCAFEEHADTEAAVNAAQELLDFVGVGAYRDVPAENLPYALTKRLEIARALATRPKVLFLDEPSSGLNPREQNDQVQIIRKIKEQGVTILIIEHVMRVIMDISDRLIVLHYGKVIAEGEPQAVYNDPQVVEAYLGGEAHAHD